MARIIGGLSTYHVPSIAHGEQVEQAGFQGMKLLTWITMRVALRAQVSKITSTYQVPFPTRAERC